MVLKIPLKDGRHVFEEYNFDLTTEQIRSNAARLEQQEDEVTKDISSEFFNDDIFAEFDLDASVARYEQQHEQQEAKQQEEAQVLQIWGEAHPVASFLHLRRRQISLMSPISEVDDAATANSTVVSDQNRRHPRLRITRESAVIAARRQISLMPPMSEGDDAATANSTVVSDQNRRHPRLRITGESAAIAATRYEPRDSEQTEIEPDPQAWEEPTSASSFRPIRYHQNRYEDTRMRTQGDDMDADPKIHCHKQDNSDHNTDTAQTVDDEDHSSCGNSADDDTDRNTHTTKNPQHNDNDETTTATAVHRRLRTCFTTTAHTFPRLTDIVVRILLPLWCIIGLTIVLGYYLGRYEGVAEIERNDAVLRDDYDILADAEGYEAAMAFLATLSVSCFEYFLVVHNTLDVTINPDTPNSTNMTEESLNSFTISMNDTVGDDHATLHTNNVTHEQFQNFNLSLTDIEQLVRNIDYYIGLEKFPTHNLTNAVHLLDDNMKLKHDLEEIRQDYIEVCRVEGMRILHQIIEVASMTARFFAKLQHNNLLEMMLEKDGATFFDSNNLPRKHSHTTFNWIRCWNYTQYGTDVNPMFGTDQILLASGNQSEFYSHMWHLSRTHLYDQYVAEAMIAANITKSSCNPVDNFDVDTFAADAIGNINTTLYNNSWTMCEDLRRRAHEQSILEASGGQMCGINMGASAWFWFVFMTTVGYGNQSPETSQGRILVGVFGWITIIIWGMVMFFAGRVLHAIIDDSFRKRTKCCNSRCLSWLDLDLKVVMLWGIISVLWIILLGDVFLYAFSYREDPGGWQVLKQIMINEFSSEDKNLQHRGEAYWFSYISMLTVGLGDFYYRPEYLYYIDLFILAYLFLIGYTFIATFLSAVVKYMLANSMMPDAGAVLHDRLLNRKVIRRKEIKYKEKNEIDIRRLGSLIEMMDDDDVENVTQRVTRIRVMKFVLVRLLYQTEHELEHYRKHGEQYDRLSHEEICKEDRFLTMVLAETEHEREQFERDRIKSGVTRSRRTGENTSDVFFEDGTKIDQVAKKLHIPNRSIDLSKTAASDYL